MEKEIACVFNLRRRKIWKIFTISRPPLPSLKNFKLFNLALPMFDISPAWMGKKNTRERTRVATQRSKQTLEISFCLNLRIQIQRTTLQNTPPPSPYDSCFPNQSASLNNKTCFRTCWKIKRRIINTLLCFYLLCSFLYLHRLRTLTFKLR